LLVVFSVSLFYRETPLNVGWGRRVTLLIRVRTTVTIASADCCPIGWLSVPIVFHRLLHR